MLTDVDYDRAMQAALDLAQLKAMDEQGLYGFGVVQLLDENGDIKQLEPFANIVTDAGDEYYARKGIVGVSPANPSAPTVVSGMKFGTGSTAAAKSGAGGALVTYKTGSNIAFDASFPVAANVGAGLGWNASYKSTWGPGVATQTGIVEAVIVNDAGSNATSVAVNTISRTVFGSVDKAAGDTLVITWNHKFLGS